MFKLLITKITFGDNHNVGNGAAVAGVNIRPDFNRNSGGAPIHSYITAAQNLYQSL